jgi:DNA-binding transcriptional LysR family regulator
MFELGQLRCFVAVAEELHFGRAAARLHMTQPPLSRQIQLLEHLLDVTLLERSSRSVRLTPAGSTFLPEARRLLRLAEGAALAVKRVAHGEAGAVGVGFAAGSSYSFLPRLVSLAKAEMPDIDLVRKEMTTAEQMEALAAGRIDLGLVRLPIDRRGREVACVNREPLLLAAPCDHPLAMRAAEPGLADLDRQPFIMYSPLEGRYFYELVVGLLRAADVAPSYVQYTSQIHTMLALVSAGIGVAVVPEAVEDLHAKGVVLRPLRPSPDTRAELHAVWRRDNESPTFRRFRETVLRRLADEVA